jgi:polysaccharide biosynthesis protein PelA
MRGPLVIVLAVLALILWASEARSAPRDPRLAGVADFAFALGGDVDSDAEVSRLAPYDLVVVDGELTGRGRVAQLRAGGAIVLGYLSVGTIEPFRSWYGRLRPYRLKDRFEEFGEYYARASDRGYRRAIAGRIAPKLLRRGFDGLFLDNTDMVEGHPKQRRGMRRLVRRLARLVHRRRGLLFAQNGERTIGPLLAVLDGWNREDVTWTYDFDRRRYAHRSNTDVEAARAALARISAAGLLVTATDYTAGGDGAAERESVANACVAGAIPFVSNIALRRLPAAPLRCAP